MSPYTMGLTAHTPWGFKVPTNFGIHHVMNPDPYKGIFGGRACRDSPAQAQRDCDCAPGKTMTRILSNFKMKQGFKIIRSRKLTHFL